MMWAKEQKRFISRPRMALMSLFTLSLCLLSLAALAEDGLTKEKPEFTVTQTEAADRVAEALHAQGLGDDIQVTFIGRRTEELVSNKEPVVMEITALQPDSSRNTFSTTLTFFTEAGLDKPTHRLGSLELLGRYEVMQEIPVVKYRTSSGTVISDNDIEWQKVPTTRLDRDTVLDAQEIIGKTPVRIIAPGRPIDTSDLQTPPVVTRQSTVYMNYKSQHISIRAVGVALEDGAVGDKVRVRNSSGGNTVEGVVSAPGQVQILPAPRAMRLADSHTVSTVQPN